MKILAYTRKGANGLAIRDGDQWRDLSAADASLPSDLSVLLQDPDWRSRVTRLSKEAPAMSLDGIRYLPPFRTSEKILCVGLNYADHIAESPYPPPSYPTFFPRFASTLVGHEAPIIKPRVSDDFDYEAELVAVIGKPARHVTKETALQHVAGYTVFNEASVRDYQFKAPQWTMGKNFDNTGACGPVFVTDDELPVGARGLRITTRVNGQLEQDANTNDLIFDVATLIALASEVLTLRPGDLIVTGTPAGVRFGKKPPKYLRDGDVCEVEVERVGLLRNVVRNEE